MSNFKLLVITIFVFLFTWGIMFISLPQHGTVKINCDVAEISPDIPVKAKELCRKARGRI
jgi:hypothetical protein